MDREPPIQPDAETVARLKSRNAALPETRRGRVSELQCALREGRYRRSDRDIAEALLAELLPGTGPRRERGGPLPG